ncbi:MAG: hypothetical protein GY946_18925 [bacterium]|nr:hypothetical protein [bacterium]
MKGRRTETAGPMAGHVRDGRRYLPQLAATGVLELQDWVRDDLPDLLWPALLMANDGTQSARRFVEWQGAVQRKLEGEVEPGQLAECLDGRLSSLEGIAGEHPRVREIVRETTASFGLLPPPVAAALASYPERPAKWLVDDGFHSPTDDDLALIAQVLLDAVGDGHREAVLKCLSIWSAVQAGVFRTDEVTIGLLRNYPIDLETRGHADAIVRASWGARRGAQLANDPTCFDASIKWAHVFWGVNSMTSRCIRTRDVREDDEKPSPATPPSIPDDATPEEGGQLQHLAMDLVSSYVEALETAPSHLYDQEQQEVHAGLVCRAGREVIVAL